MKLKPKWRELSLDEIIAFVTKPIKVYKEARFIRPKRRTPK